MHNFVRNIFKKDQLKEGVMIILKWVLGKHVRLELVQDRVLRWVTVSAAVITAVLLSEISG
jgi:hypothetical protein